MAQVNVQEAKTRLSDLLLRSERGEETVIARAGRPRGRTGTGGAGAAPPVWVDAPRDPRQLRRAVKRGRAVRLGVTVSTSYLLDTHIVLWLLGDPERIPETVGTEVAERANLLVAWAASALKIATLVRIGKLDAPTLPAALNRRLSDLGTTLLPISVEHALLADSLRWDHRDPFDRILVAQATLEALVLVTVDSAILAATHSPHAQLVTCAPLNASRAPGRGG